MHRVLIVDDHAVFRSWSRRMLEDEGFEVVAEAADLAGARRALEEHHPDLLLLDIQLPDGDGFGLAAELAERGPRPVIVLVSARPRTSFGSRLATSTVHAFLSKDELSGAALRTLVGAT